MSKKTTKVEVETALPEVLSLVRRFGRPIIGQCLKKISDIEKKKALLEKARLELHKKEQEIVDLEKALK